MNAFEIQQTILLKLQAAKKYHLSLSKYDTLGSKDLLTNKHTRNGRLSPTEHLRQLVGESRLTNPDTPLLMISCRNTLSNIRCIAYAKAVKGHIISVKEEVFSPERPYFILGEKDNQLILDNFTPNQQQPQTFEWFISGVPVLWDDMNEDAIFEKIVTEASDHSHVWHIPRGSHPNVTPTTLKSWSDLHQIFLDTLDQPSAVAYSALVKYAEENGLEREYNYLHNILGVNGEGKLIQYAAKGKLEDLGHYLRKFDVKRAIMVDNSGSVGTIFFPKGSNIARNKLFSWIRKVESLFFTKRTDTQEPIQLFGAPNHRPPGTAYLVVELENSNFD